MHFGITEQSVLSTNVLFKQMIEYVQKGGLVSRAKVHVCSYKDLLGIKHTGFTFPTELCGKCCPTRQIMWLGAKRKREKE